MFHDGAVEHRGGARAFADRGVVGGGVGVVEGGGDAVGGGEGDLGELVLFECAFEVFDLVGAEDASEEHLGEDVVGGEFGGAFVSAEGGELAGAVGAGGGEDCAGYCC